MELVHLDLDERLAVVRADDDGSAWFAHALRGALAGLLTGPGWHVVVALTRGGPPRPVVAAVLADGRGWAAEQGCRLTVTTGQLPRRTAVSPDDVSP